MYTIDELENWLDRISAAYEEDPLDKKTKADLREIQYQVNKMLESWPRLIQNCEQTIQEYENDLENKNLSKAKRAEASDAIEGNKLTIVKYKYEIEKLEALKNHLDRYFTDKKPFDKYQCIQNIKDLMNEKDVKIGQIEGDANVRPGYMSRLNKPDNETMPSITFLISAAKLLDVSLEELLFRKSSELSEDEKYINDFLNDLILDTKNHEFHWEKERDSILCSRYNKFNDSNIPYHPLLCQNENIVDAEGDNYLISYVSQFYKESDVFVKYCYYANLPGYGSKIYLVWCYTKENDKYIPNKQFLEVYITDKNGKANPVCNALKVAPSICITLNNLCKLAMQDASNIYLNDETRSVIEDYKTWRSGFDYGTERSKDDKK